MTNAALISELEAAKEGSRALSDKVLLARGFTRQAVKNQPNSWMWFKPDGRQLGALGVQRPHPTGNLQDIADLVPEDMKWGVDSLEAWVGQGDDEDTWGNAKTPALSLSIALLKAMETADG